MASLKNDLKKIYTAAISSVDPFNAVKNFIKVKNNRIILNFKNKNNKKYFSYNNFKNVYVVGAGKATAKMALAIEDIFVKHLSGIIIVKYGYTEKLNKIKCIEAAHPVPDQSGIKGSQLIKDILEKATKDDLVISLISGGASSLLTLPADKIKLSQIKKITSLLLKSGATIHEINCVRKHLSKIKGGNAALYAYPATVINLMISDVVGNDIDIIGSGPFVADNSTYKDALDILKKYLKMDERKNEMLLEVMEYLKAGVKGHHQETPDNKNNCFNNVYSFTVASNIIALKAAAKESKSLKYNTVILSSFIEGEAKDVAIVHAAIAKEILASNNPTGLPACILSGGETTVTVKGKGKGGRNTEFAMHCAAYIEGIKNVLAASIGSDGGDGPTDAAGAMVDGDTLGKCIKNDLNFNSYVNDNDSYNLFNKIGGLIKTGPTNTNVMDIRIVLLKK